MTINSSLPLQTAVYGRLTERLATAGADGSAIVVLDHVPDALPELWVRMDGFRVGPAKTNMRNLAQHSFQIRIFHNFDRDSSPNLATVKGVLPTITDALDGWSGAVAGASSIELLGVDFSVEPKSGSTPPHASGVANFIVQIM